MEIGYYFTFDTISEALRFEKVLKSSNISVKLMPVPRRFSSSCGTCAAIEKNNLETVKILIKEKNLIYHEVYDNE